MKLLRKLVTIVVTGLIGWGGQPTGWADAMLPRYRIEDMGLLSQYSSMDTSSRLWFLSDGGIWAERVALDSKDKLYRKGEYLLSFTYSNTTPGLISQYNLKQDGSDINLLKSIDPNSSSLVAFSSAGKGLFFENTGKSGYREIVYDTKSGQEIPIDVSMSPVNIQSVFGINHAGEMAGEASFDSDVPGAIYYPSIDSKAVLLSTLVDNLREWRLKSATDINDSGEIIGWGYDYGIDHALRVFKLTPTAQVPEPSTWLIFGIGSLWLLRKRFTS